MHIETMTFLRCHEAWFDMLDGVSVMRISIDEPGIPLAFWCPTGVGIVRFTHVGDMKGVRVFQANELRLEGGPTPCEQDPMYLLEGPFERALPNAS